MTHLPICVPRGALGERATATGPRAIAERHGASRVVSQVRSLAGNPDAWRRRPSRRPSQHRRPLQGHTQQDPVFEGSAVPQGALTRAHGGMVIDRLFGCSLMTRKHSLFHRIISLFRRKFSLFDRIGNSIKKGNQYGRLGQLSLPKTSSGTN